MSFLDKLNRFAGNPVNMNMKRSKFNLSHGHKLSFVSGKLIPIMVDEVLPDDTIKLNVASIVRSITPALPVMDNAYLDLFAFWVPARLCTVHDKDWQKIHGENTSGFWAPAAESTLVNTGNTFKLANSGDAVGVQSLCDYLGIPISFYHSTLELSRLPFNGYWLIWNEWFRDQNTQSPIDWKSFTNAQFIIQSTLGTNLCEVNKFHDYFTSALPTPQKGASVLLPMAGQAPVITGADHVNTFVKQLDWITSNSTGIGANTRVPLFVKNFSSFASNAGSSVSQSTEGITTSSDMLLQPRNLWADLTSATAVSVNEMRQAFAIQKLFEKDARGGWACAF